MPAVRAADKTCRQAACGAWKRPGLGGQSAKGVPLREISTLLALPMHGMPAGRIPPHPRPPKSTRLTPAVQAAQAAWEDARATGVERDLILFSAMIDTCAKVGGVRPPSQRIYPVTGEEEALSWEGYRPGMESSMSSAAFRCCIPDRHCC